MLPNYLIICRSLTYAQRTASILERAGIPASIHRAPRELTQEGCSHAVRVAERQLIRALEALNRANMAPTRVLLAGVAGDYQEVLL